MFPEVPKKTFPELEEEVLRLWEENFTFLKSVEAREGAPQFTIYDGPPFATGLPHYGHLLPGTIKDVLPRYKTMKGFYVPRRFGWDCHGLPVEHEIEKLHGLLGAHQIEEFGIAEFNEECRSIVTRYSDQWRATVNRIGRWVDFDKTWRTMDQPFMESVWWIFKQLYGRGHVYEGFRVMPYSAKLGTPLSNFEAGENYKDVDDPAITVRFQLKDDPSTSILAWTTTPWTLISNLALMVGPEIDYVKVREGDQHFIVAAARAPVYFEEPEIVGHMKGADLLEKRYEPLFPYFAGQDAFRIVGGSDVTTEDGTGIVHSAPAFGEADFWACKEAGIEIVCPVDTNGRFTAEVPEYQGQFVKDADKAIIERLKTMGHLVKRETIRHRYPFCWRSDTPLIYKAVSTWFVGVEAVREQLLKSNEQIHWVPDHLKEGRFGKWLANARDWNIARNRYWGTPIPLWRSEDGELLAVGSIAELEELTGEKIDDLHRHHIDQLVIEKGGKKFTRIPEVFDCWFESGSMPYAQNHYPFENKESTEKNFPADFIAEGLDQTRGWFYTLTILSTLLFEKPAFKNVIVNGLILAEDGLKMSKRLQNYPEPELILNRYGADALRLYLLHSPAVHANDLKFSEKEVELTLRQVMLPLWNAYSFFVTYARIYKPKLPAKPKTTLDRWILSMLQKLIHDVEKGLDGYDLAHAVEPFVGFVDQLTNWYIRLSRRRFWEHEDDEAFGTLYAVLMGLCKVAAPFIPFITESIFQGLRQEGDPDSVHLCDYPDYIEAERDLRLEAEMEVVQRAVSLGHALRKKHKRKVRQPLRAVYIASGNPEVVEFLSEQKELIASELNVKEVVVSGDEKEYVQLRAKPNFRVLGKKVGKNMKRLQPLIEAFTAEQISAIRSDHSVEVEEFTLEPEDVMVERVVREGLDAENAGNITVLLDTTLDEELELEALARELVNKVSTMRREADLAYTARIELTLETTPRVQEALRAHEEYVKHELLALSVKFAPCEGQSWDLNGEATKIELHAVQNSPR
jgi:isoleucyl-tRNA synthetase